MNNNSTLVDSLARGRVVENLVVRTTGRPASELGDLVQMVYEILLRKPPQNIERVVKNKALYFYIVAIIRNLYFSKTSPYHRKIQHPDQHDSLERY